MGSTQGPQQSPSKSPKLIFPSPPTTSVKTLRRLRMAPVFLNLPAEVRNRIYYEYYLVTGGYAYHFGSNKLVEACSGRPLDVALASACKQIYRETLGIPFDLNQITFVAVDASESEYSRRCRVAHSTLYAMTGEMFLACVHCEYEGGSRNWFHLPDPMKETLATEFPRFKDFFGDGPDGPYGIRMTTSLPRTARFRLANRGVQLLAQHYGANQFSRGVRETVRKRSSRFIRSMSDEQIWECCHTHWDPWFVPTMEELVRVEDLLFGASRINTSSTEGSGQRQDVFSATSMAVRFLSSLPWKVRKQFRYLRLIDDQVESSCTSQGAHFQGLIPFFRENSDLHVECVVKMLTAVYSDAEQSIVIDGSPFPVGDDLVDMSEDSTEAVAHYMTEAFELENRGLPPGVFTLIFDGSPDTGLCARVFRETTHKMLIERLELESEFASKPKNLHTRASLRTDMRYVMEDFPRGMRELFDGTGVLRRNFDMDEPPVQESVVQL